MFQKLYATVRKAYPQNSNQNAQLHAKRLWDELKEKENFSAEFEKVINELKDKAFRSKAKMTGFFTNATKSKPAKLPEPKNPDQQTQASTSECRPANPSCCP